MPVALDLLDLSAAFDKLDHEQLPNHLSMTFGLKDVFLIGFRHILVTDPDLLRLIPHFLMQKLFRLVSLKGMC